ncbi:cytochrome bc1 complex diheme cytochrome c subunit [Gulosibacter chungangensis]|uniref:Cytochrome bc1 complex cytochrome c subunit n=1 Tax=Gulosibacter chungangensis TaxID=979746 RepID=A0A7J5BCT7_9MICO|nr:cytochrome c [Gulosibacter chungangensis]KAB1644010.1 c-type cytochrome [Gulosibacter chungangensis]
MSLATKSPSSAKKSRKRSRRTPLATAALLGVGLLLSGGAYGAVDTLVANAAEDTVEVDMTATETIAEGEALFSANCATCHGMDAVGTDNGPSLIGVGSASVHFQVGTGRMPMQKNAPQAPSKQNQFTEEQTLQMAAYVASLAPGPAIPDSKYTQADGNAAHGAELFRINCAMCHNVAAAGGALTEGKYAPELQTVDPVHIYEAMQTGPQNMPVFSDTNLTAQDKADIITAIVWMTDNTNMVGGYNLGGVGPVAEGLFIWVFGIGGSVAFAIWLTNRPN